jgi:hypothetical protein
MTYSQVGLFTGMYGILAILWSIPAGFFAKKIGENWALLLSTLFFITSQVCLQNELQTGSGHSSTDVSASSIFWLYWQGQDKMS